MVNTWSNNTPSTRIDYIFVSENIIRSIEAHEVIDIKEEFNTDHKGLNITIQFDESFNKSYTENRNRNPYIKFNDDEWKDIAMIFEETVKNKKFNGKNVEILWDDLVITFKQIKEWKEKEVLNKPQRTINDVNWSRVKELEDLVRIN